MSPEEIDTVAKYIAESVCGDDVFDGDQADSLDNEREWYRGHARAVLRTVRSLGWNEPPRLAAIPEITECDPENYVHTGPWVRVPPFESVDRCVNCGTEVGK